MAVTLVSDTEDINGAGGDVALAEPASLATNDLLLCYALSYHATTPATPALIAGFTDVLNLGLNPFRVRCMRRVADGTEGPTYTSTIGTSTYSDGKMLRITGVNAAAPINAAAYDQAIASPLSLPPCRSTVDNCKAFAFISGDGTMSATPAGWTLYERWATNVGAIYEMALPVAGTDTGHADQAFTGGAAQFALVVIVAIDPVVPLAPTITTLDASHGRVAVQWTPGSDGSSAITDWDIDAATAAAPTTWLGVQATGSVNPYGSYVGLTNGTAYVFRVRGVNAVGDGAWSATSGSSSPVDDRGFILLEDGTSRFLLEDGVSKFLLESGAAGGGTPTTVGARWGVGV